MLQEKGRCRQIDPLIDRDCSPEDEAANLLAAADVRRLASLILLMVAIVSISVWSFSAINSYLPADRTAPRVELDMQDKDVEADIEVLEAEMPNHTPEHLDMSEDPVPDQVLGIMREVEKERGVPDLPESCDPVADLLEAELMPEWMVYVAWRESRCSPDAKRLLTKTGDQSFGYFQINTLDNLWSEVKRLCGVTERRVLLDPATNVRCASDLYRRYGYKPWHSGVYFTAP